MYHYWGYGLHIASEMEFPELLPFEFETPDVTIRIGKTPETLIGNNVVHRVGVSISPNEYLLKTLNIANYYAANGNEIIIEPLPDGDEKSVRLFALSNAFAAILYQCNLIPLHASGIVHNDAVILFCGASGAGKSTLVTALQQKGYKVFTDDVCVLQPQPDGSITAVSSYPMIKLWEDSFEKTGLIKISNDKKIRPELPKYAKFYHNAFDTTPKKIKQIFIIEKSNAVTDIVLQQLTALQAFAEIQKNVYRLLQLNAMQKRNAHFTTIGNLAKTISVYKSQRADHSNTLPELLPLIETKFL